MPNGVVLTSWADRQANTNSAAWLRSLLGWVGVPIAVFLIALIARLHDLDGESIWLDEAYSYQSSKPDLSYKQVVWSAGSDFHPPLYYLILHVALQFGSDLFWLRLPSVLFSALAAGVTAVAGRIVAGPAAGLLAGLLYSLAPTQVAFAQEARMYALLSFEISAGLTAILWLIADRGRLFSTPVSVLSLQSGPLTLFCWLVVSAAFGSAMLTHNLGVFFPIVAAVAILAIWAKTPFHRVKDLGSFLLFSALGVALWLPWAPYLIKQLKRIDAGYWITFPTVSAVLSDIVKLLFGVEQPVPGIAAAISSLALIVFVVVRKRATAGTMALLMLFALGPVVLSLAISLWRPLYLSRTLIWIAIPSFIAIAMAVCSLPRRLHVAVLSIVLLAVTAFELHLYFGGQSKPDWNAVVQHIRSNWQEGDAIVIHRASAVLPFNFHKRLTAGEGTVLPEVIGIEAPQDAYAIKLPGGTKRVWLVYSFESATDWNRIILKSFQDKGRVVHARDFGGPVNYGRPSVTLIRIDPASVP